ncbi:FecCD family ABC transporter permease [Kribbella catacumbae]|uniref:FecCD family ABC transporter permease n=1 Tax=Kribbella catacumbae TaxID=460086 RepID=UPI00037901F4|nr:iron ABC transporter permease [Kribbella catacumbae]
MPPPSVTDTATTGPSGAAPRAEKRRPRARRTTLIVGLVVCVALLVLVSLLSIAIGSKQIPLPTVIDALRHYDDANTDHVIVRSLRVPRTVIGLLVGAALGLSGALMQGVTRNPLADPGILGVNGGAALFVVAGIYWFGLSSLTAYVWLAFAGAAAASVAVYLLGSLGREGATPVKLALAGAAMTAMLGSLTTALLIGDVDTFDQFRFWAVGSLAGRGSDIASQVAPFILIGIVLALVSGRVLNALSLGDDVARSLGQRVGMARLFTAVTVVLLSGAATAAAGPIGFIGLTIPHIARLVTGPDYRWILPYSMLLAPILLLGSDVIGRVVAQPGELQVGIVTAVIGAPFFIALVRRRKLADL